MIFDYMHCFFSHSPSVARLVRCLVCLFTTLTVTTGQSAVPVDLREYKEGGAVVVREEDGLLQAVWKASAFTPML